MHIISTIRHQIGPKTALNVEAIMVISRPYYIAYTLCKEGSLVQYLAMNTISMDVRIKVHFLIFFFGLKSSQMCEITHADNKEDNKWEHLFCVERAPNSSDCTEGFIP